MYISYMFFLTVPLFAKVLTREQILEAFEKEEIFDVDTENPRTRSMRVEKRRKYVEIYFTLLARYPKEYRREEMINEGIVTQRNKSFYKPGSYKTKLSREYLDPMTNKSILIKRDLGMGRGKGVLYKANPELIYAIIEEYVGDDLKDCVDLLRDRVENEDKPVVDKLLVKDSVDFITVAFHFLLSLLSRDGKGVIFSLNPVMFYKNEYDYWENWKRFETPRKEGIIRYKNVKNLRKVVKVVNGEISNWAYYYEETTYKRAFEYYCSFLPENPNVEVADEFLLGILVSRFYLGVLGKDLYKQFAPDYMEHVMRETEKIVKDLKHLKWYWKNGRKLNLGEKPW